MIVGVPHRIVGGCQFEIRLEQQRERTDQIRQDRPIQFDTRIAAREKGIATDDMARLIHRRRGDRKCAELEEGENDQQQDGEKAGEAHIE